MKKRRSRGNKPTYCRATKTAKVRYRTANDAKSAKAGREDNREGVEVRIYPCHACGGWHLTHWVSEYTPYLLDPEVSSEKLEEPTEE